MMSTSGQQVEVLHSETVFEGRVFDVRRDRVRLPNEHTVQLDVVDHAGSVTLVPVDEDGQVWLIRQYRHPAGRYLLELPAGVTEAGEDPETSGRREIREEIGMAAGRLELVGTFYLAPGYSTEFMYVFLARDLNSSPLEGDEDEVLSIEKMPFEQALKLARRGEIHDVKTIAALFLADAHLRANA